MSMEKHKQKPNLVPANAAARTSTEAAIAHAQESLAEKPSEKSIVLKGAELAIIFSPESSHAPQGPMRQREWREEHGSFPTIWDPRAKGETRFGKFVAWKDVPSKVANLPPFKSAIFAPIADAPDAHLGPFAASGANLVDKLASVQPGDECAITFLGRLKIDDAKSPMKQFRVAINRTSRTTS